MRKVLIVLVVLLLLLAVGELAAARFAESEIEERVAKEITADVEAEVDSFPLATRLVALEEIGRIEITLSDAEFPEITVDDMTVEATGLVIPRNRLFDGKVRPTAIASASVTAFLSTASLGEATGTPVPAVDLSSATAHLENGTLTVEAGGAPPISLEVPAEALPCSATGEVTADGVRLRCEVDRLPDVILESIPR